ncbi:YdjC-like protein [Candidatus Magnetoovum chiemensis]|nr:YdjC-like protein [Candidatus Magnetoovum chiemensis]
MVCYNNIMREKIIINADDLGLKLCANRSIEELMRLGAVSSASIMVNRSGECFWDAVRIAKEFKSRASFGLHLDLDRFFLFDESGHYGVDENDIIENYCSIINARGDEIKYSVIAQIDKLRGCGIEVSHLDGHHFAHLFMESLAIILPIMSARSISAMRYNSGFYLSQERRALSEGLIARYGIRVPDGFGDLWALDLQSETPHLRDERIFRRASVSRGEAVVRGEAVSQSVEIMAHTQIAGSGCEEWAVAQHNYLRNNIERLRCFDLTSFKKKSV